MEKLTTLYNIAKSEAAHREDVYSRMAAQGHPDAEKVRAFHNGVIADAIRDYKAQGGKRNIDRFLGVL